MNVFSYWSGPIPDWIKTCLSTFRRKCMYSKFHLITPDNCNQYVPNLNKRWLDLHPSVGTDCLRAHLLAEHGGLWADADTICLREPFLLIHNRYKKEQFLYSRWKDGRAIAGYVYAPKGHPVALRWRDGVDSTLRHGFNVGWGDLGEKLLTWCLNGVADGSTWEIPLETFLPVDIDREVEVLFTEQPWRDRVSIRTILFGLNHSWMMANKLEEMTKNPAGSRLMIHKLLQEWRRI